MNKKENPLQGFWEKVKPVLQKIGKVFVAIGGVFAAIGRVFGKIGKFIYWIRKILLAIPVVVGAIYIVQYVQERLPERVGLLIQESGAYTYVLSRDMAMNGCMVITDICLLLMFFSRRTIYPWLISIFSLVLPVALLITNIFPA